MADRHTLEELNNCRPNSSSILRRQGRTDHHRSYDAGTAGHTE